MEAEKIKEFVEDFLPEMEKPEVLVRDINQVDTSEYWKTDATSFCMMSPVQMFAGISNMGVAILYDIVNNKMGKDYFMERCYFPEKRLMKRLREDNIPLFAKESCHALKDFDIIGYASYYSLQYYGFPILMELSKIPVQYKDRPDDLEHPLVIMGGIQTFNAESVAPIFDAFCIGEGEEMLPAFIELYRKCKKEGKTKTEFLVEATNTIQGIWCPNFYEYEYYPADDPKKPNQIKRMIKLRDDVPDICHKAVVNFKKTPMCTNMLCGNSEGLEMSVGSAFISVGCGNLCSFCQGSHISMPYRERDFEDVKAASEALVENTGSTEVTPYAFNLSDYSLIKKYIKWLIQEKGKKLSTSSQRMDLFDEDFAKVAKLGGSNTITFAIEGGSPRSRKVLNKNLTEKQILDVLEIAFKAGFKKIKLYNISNIPYETQEDIDYYYTLAQKIRDLRDRLGVSAEIKWSWTPFQAKNFTPMQWAETRMDFDEDGVPVFRRTLDGVYLKLREVGDTMRVSTNFDTTLFSQTLVFGDRRWFKFVMAIAHDPDISYMGGMTIGKDKLPHFTDVMNNVMGEGLDWHFLFREKDLDENFCWDYIDAGITKDYLREQFKKVKEAAVGPIDEEGLLRPPCLQKCTNCGVCTNPKMQKIDRPMGEDIKKVADEIEKRFQPKVRTFRLLIDVPADFRYVHESKLKMRIRRACYKAGIPVRDIITFVSDDLKWQDWTAGIELAEMQITDIRFDCSEEELKERINANLDGMKVLRVEQYSRDVTFIKDNVGYTLYSITLPDAIYPYTTIMAGIDEYEKNPDYTIKVKMPGDMRDSWVTKKVKAHDYCADVFVKRLDKDVYGFAGTEVFALLSRVVSMYDLIPALLSTTKRRILHYPVFKREYLMKSGENELDMFADVCKVCGKEIELNIFGEPVSEDFCIHHKYVD